MNGYYNLLHKSSQGVLGAMADHHTPHALIHDNAFGDHHKWRLEGPLADGGIRLVHALTDKVLDVLDEGGSIRANLYHNTNSDSQIWRIQGGDRKGFCKIIHKSTGKALGTRGGNISAAVHIDTDEDTDHQEWRLVPALDVPTKTWMTHCFDKIRDKKLYEMVLPGVYGAGLCKTEAATSGRNQGVYHQLCGGVRYFDFCVAATNDGYRVDHDNVEGTHMADIMADVARYMDETGDDKELVILNFSRFTDFEENDLYFNFFSHFGSYVKDCIVCNPGFERQNNLMHHTVNEFLRDGQGDVRSRVLIKSDHPVFSSVKQYHAAEVYREMEIPTHKPGWAISDEPGGILENLFLLSWILAPSPDGFAQFTKVEFEDRGAGSFLYNEMVSFHGAVDLAISQI